MKLCWVNGRDFAIVVQVIKRLVNAGKILTVGEDQKLVFAETLGLVHVDLLRTGRRDE